VGPAARQGPAAVLAPLGSEPMSPFWIWMQIMIVLCVLVAAVVAVVKLV
jgi:hypothetical protein